MRRTTTWLEAVVTSSASALTSLRQRSPHKATSQQFSSNWHGHYSALIAHQTRPASWPLISDSHQAAGSFPRRTGFRRFSAPGSGAGPQVPSQQVHPPYILLAPPTRPVVLLAQTQIPDPMVFHPWRERIQFGAREALLTPARRGFLAFPT